MGPAGPQGRLTLAARRRPPGARLPLMRRSPVGGCPAAAGGRTASPRRSGGPPGTKVGPRRGPSGGPSGAIRGAKAPRRVLWPVPLLAFRCGRPGSRKRPSGCLGAPWLPPCCLAAKKSFLCYPSLLPFAGRPFPASVMGGYST